MRLPAKGKIEWNLNTVIALCGFAGLFVAWGIAWGEQSTTNKNQDEKIEKIDRKFTEQISTGSAERKQTDARFDERIRGVETEVRKIDNITYRITVQEQSTATLAKSVEDIKNSITTLASDVRVVREILQRDNPRTAK